MAVIRPSISRELGEITASLRAIAVAFEDERDHAAQSRATIHRRLDEVVDRVSGIEGKMAVRIVADEALKARLGGVETTAEEWRQILQTGRTIGWIVTALGLTSAAALAWAADAVRAAVSHWLRLP